MLTPITNTPRNYAWGAPGGVTRVLGGTPGEAPEAELWLGAHPSGPSTFEGGGAADLRDWEQQTGRRLPYLLKVLCAAAPLSLQAHPTPAQAEAGFARENAAGIPLDARERSYKDPYAKPELIVAVSDAFEALCGFRPLDETRDAVDALAAVSARPDAFTPWRDRLAGDDPVRSAFTWLLSGDDQVGALLAALVPAAEALGDEAELVTRLAAAYPGDPGIAVALLLNHVTLLRGECLWLPAGNIHAYLRGDGMELMGPSDNVLRGGLTPKHVDIAELGKVLDFTAGAAPRLAPVAVATNVVAYRPAMLPTGRGIPFELLAVTGDARLELVEPSILVALEGAFEVSGSEAGRRMEHGDIAFTPGANLDVAGAGRLFVATSR